MIMEKNNFFIKKIDVIFCLFYTYNIKENLWCTIDTVVQIYNNKIYSPQFCRIIF